MSENVEGKIIYFFFQQTSKLFVGYSEFNQNWVNSQNVRG